MSGTRVTALITGVAATAGKAFGHVFADASVVHRRLAAKEKKAARVGRSLLLALPLLVTLVPEALDSTRTIDVTVSRYGVSPERIEVRVGERVRLNAVSVDGGLAFQVKALGLNAAIPDNGKAVTLEFTPREVGSFAINRVGHCGRRQRCTQGSLIVTPRA